MAHKKQVDVFITFEGVDPEVAADLMADLTEWYDDVPYSFSSSPTEVPESDKTEPDTEEDPDVHEIDFNLDYDYVRNDATRTEECCSATADNSLKAGAYPSLPRLTVEAELAREERLAERYYSRGFDAGVAYAKEGENGDLVNVLDPTEVKFSQPRLRTVGFYRG